MLGVTSGQVQTPGVMAAAMANLPRSAQRVQDAATLLNLDISVLEMPDSTRTAEEAAAACGCDVAQIVKSLIFQGSETATPYLLLVSGANRVNEARMTSEIGEALKRPQADYVRELTGYAIGGVPPFGHAAPLATFMDQDLLAFDRVWAAAGTPKCLFSVEPNALKAAIGTRVITMT